MSWKQCSQDKHRWLAALLQLHETNIIIHVILSEFRTSEKLWRKLHVPLSGHEVPWRHTRGRHKSKTPVWFLLLLSSAQICHYWGNSTTLLESMELPVTARPSDVTPLLRWAECWCKTQSALTLSYLTRHVVHCECFGVFPQGAGTDEHALIEILVTRSNEEIQAMNAAYQEGELGGRNVVIRLCFRIISDVIYTQFSPECQQPTSSL